MAIAKLVFDCNDVSDARKSVVSNAKEELLLENPVDTIHRTLKLWNFKPHAVIGRALGDDVRVMGILVLSFRLLLLRAAVQDLMYNISR